MLIEQYLHQLEMVENHLKKLKENPLLASDVDYKKTLSSLEKSNQILLKGLGLSQAIIDMASELEELEKEIVHEMDDSFEDIVKEMLK